jgi:HlyD family secretion protein
MRSYSLKSIPQNKGKRFIVNCRLSIVNLVAAMLLPLSACSNHNKEYDASGIFEATEVTVSSQGYGELMEFNLMEGQKVEASKQIGYVDTIQLYLKKMQLLSNIKSAGSREYNVSKQVASIRQQIATQKNEQKRYENLIKSNAATQKQLDDINAQIALLEKQLIAQKETLENNNRGVSEESSGLEIQIAQIEDQIKKCIISSPINGTVLSKYAEQGELATQGRALFKVADIANMNLRVYVTADQLASLKIGQQVKVYADLGRSDRKEYPGTVSWISDKAEFTPKTIQTRDERANLVYAVKVAVKNDDFIKKGMYGDIKIN